MEFNELVKQYGFVNAFTIMIASGCFAIGLYMFNKIKLADEFQKQSLTRQLNEFPEQLKKNTDKLDVVITQLNQLSNLITQLTANHQRLEMIIDKLKTK